LVINLFSHVWDSVLYLKLLVDVKRTILFEFIYLMKIRHVTTTHTHTHARTHQQNNGCVI